MDTTLLILLQIRDPCILPKRIFFRVVATNETLSTSLSTKVSNTYQALGQPRPTYVPNHRYYSWSKIPKTSDNQQNVHRTTSRATSRATTTSFILSKKTKKRFRIINSRFFGFSINIWFIMLILLHPLNFYQSRGQKQAVPAFKNRGVSACKDPYIYIYIKI